MSNKEINNSRVTFTGTALKVPEPNAVKVSRPAPIFFRDTVLRGRKLPGAVIKTKKSNL